MENNKLPDTPWHVGYAKKEESDPRRHKARCIYLKEGICRCGYDGCYTRKCGGSSHCIHYSDETEEIESDKREQIRLETLIRDEFAQPSKKIKIEDVYYQGKKYYKIILSEAESIMVPYTPRITKLQVQSYIKQYYQKK